MRFASGAVKIVREHSIAPAGRFGGGSVRPLRPPVVTAESGKSFLFEDAFRDAADRVCVILRSQTLAGRESGYARLLFVRVWWSDGDTEPSATGWWGRLASVHD